MAAARKPGPVAALQRDRQNAQALAKKVSKEQLRKLLERAQQHLDHRLSTTPGLSGVGSDSFTAAQKRVTLIQVQAIAKELGLGVELLLKNTAQSAAVNAAGGVYEYIAAMEKKYAGSVEQLPLKEAMLLDRATQGAQSSLLHRLRDDPKKGKGILSRYTDEVVESFEQSLQLRFVARTSWSDTRKALVEASPFLQGKPASWSERIVRTEIMGVHGRASLEASKEANDVLGDAVKILCATFDDRTGADSYAVHGQIRRVDESFDWWEGSYATPPNRPNDREIVVTHRVAWPIPEELQPKSDAEVQARWAQLGNKKACPKRPKMTTVSRALFGKENAGSLAKTSPAPVAPPTPAPPPPAPPPEPPKIVRAPKPVAVPEPPPPAPIAPAPHEHILAKKIGGQAGSNKGGLYEGLDGVKRYVKFYKNPAQAHLEHLTNKIYADLGLGTVESEVFESPEGLGYASKILKGDKLGTNPSAAAAKNVMRGFAADVLLKNWDAVGLSGDNIIVGVDGVNRIDKGGALLYRAQGGLKPADSLHKLDEWTSFLDPKVNPQYAAIAKKAGVTKAEDVPGLEDSITAISKLRDAAGGWAKYVDQHVPGLAAAEKQAVIAMLEERTKKLEGKATDLALEKEAANAPDAPKPAPVPKKGKLAVGDTVKYKAVAFSPYKTTVYTVVGEAPGKKPSVTITWTDADNGSQHTMNEFEAELVKVDAAGVPVAKPKKKGKVAVDIQSLPKVTVDYGHEQLAREDDHHNAIAEKVVGRMKRSPDPKSRDQAMAIRSYSSSAYKSMNAAVKNIDKVKSDSLKKRVKDLLSTFDDPAIPPPPSRLFRGIPVTPETAEKILAKDEQVFEAFTSSSRSIATALSFGHENKGAAVIFEFRLKSKHGRHLPIERESSVPSERETLLKPGIRWRVLERSRLMNGGRQNTSYMVLEEI